MHFSFIAIDFENTHLILSGIFSSKIHLVLLQQCRDCEQLL
jgi:hypothetical protein